MIFKNSMNFRTSSFSVYLCLLLHEDADFRFIFLRVFAAIGVYMCVNIGYIVCKYNIYLVYRINI